MLRKAIVVVAVLLSLPHAGAAAPKFSGGTSIAGVVVYQDDLDPTQFYYLPAQVDATLGGTLKDFKVTYWGIGPAHWAQESSGALYPIAGAIVAGTASLDISPAQRAAAIAEIKKAFSVQNPKLLPLAMSNVTVSPTIDDETLAIGSAPKITFPTSVAFGSQFAFSVGTGNSLFAQVVAAEQANDWSINTNPLFAVNVLGDVEFVGDPWTAEIRCDLAQVWSQTRSAASAGVNIGWFTIGEATYKSIAQALEKSGACSFKMMEGSLDTEKHGRQVFEMVKKLYEEINSKALAGEGFFRFEPNPEAPPANASSPGWWPWSVSINLAYSSAHFTQKLSYANKISYTGHFRARVPSAMTLAVSCNNATKKYFVDLSNTAEACITQRKVEIFNERAKKEAAAKHAKIEALLDKLIAKQITQEQYEQLVAYYNRISLTETVNPLAAPENDAVSSAAFPKSEDARPSAVDPKSLRNGFTDAQLEAMEKAELQRYQKKAK